MDPRPGLDSCEKRKISHSSLESSHDSSGIQFIAYLLYQLHYPGSTLKRSLCTFLQPLKNGIYLHGTQLSSTFSVHWMPCLKYLINTKSSNYGNTIVQIFFHVLLPLLYTYHNNVHCVRLQTIDCVTIQMWPCRTWSWFHRQHNLLILFWQLIWNYKGF